MTLKNFLLSFYGENIFCLRVSLYVQNPHSMQIQLSLYFVGKKFFCVIPNKKVCHLEKPVIAPPPKKKENRKNEMVRPLGLETDGA